MQPIPASDPIPAQSQLYLPNLIHFLQQRYPEFTEDVFFYHFLLSNSLLMFYQYMLMEIWKKLLMF